MPVAGKTRVATVAAVLATAGLCAGQSSHQQRVETVNQALRAFDEAAGSPSPGQARQLYQRSAGLFERLVADGVHNGKLYYDLGNVYLRLGDLGRAILNYRRAERLIPADPNLRENLRFARSLCNTRIDRAAERRLIRSLLFWHFDTSQRARACVALVSFSLIWGLLMVRLFTPRRWLRNVALACGLLSAILAVSVGVSRYERARHLEGVVISEGTVVRKGNGASYEQRFEEPLDAGVEFTVLETRPDAAGERWYRVAFPNETQGWIPANAAEII